MLVLVYVMPIEDLRSITIRVLDADQAAEQERVRLAEEDAAKVGMQLSVMTAWYTANYIWAKRLPSLEEALKNVVGERIELSLEASVDQMKSLLKTTKKTTSRAGSD